MNNPYEAPKSDFLEELEPPLERGYGGLPRIAYLPILLITGFVHQAVLLGIGGGEMAYWSIQIVVYAVHVLTAFFRLKNIGANGWWGLLMLVPLISIIVIIRCAAYQEGYQNIRKIDLTGKIILGIFLTLFLLVIVMMVLNR